MTVLSKNLRRFIPFISFFIATSCSNDPKFEFSGNVITIKKAGDIGNKNHAADFWAEIAVDEDAISSILEVRTVFVDAVLNPNGISESDILSLPTGSYFSISKFNFLDKNKLVIEPGSSINDSNGQPINPGKKYLVAIAAIGNDNAISLPPLMDFTLTTKSEFTGKYTGIWNDEKIKNLPVSMTLFEDMTGRLYYNKGFRPCCGGTEDATLEMKINGDGTATFNFSQFLGDYPAGTGGHCETQMSTNGRLIDNSLSLNSFPFSDCDGGGRTVRISSMIKQ
jgi:hypothetical protein